MGTAPGSGADLKSKKRFEVLFFLKGARVVVVVIAFLRAGATLPLVTLLFRLPCYRIPRNLS